MSGTDATDSVRHGADVLWEALQRLDCFTERVLATPKGRPARGAHRRAILLLLLTKALKSYRAVKLLCAAGYGEDATILLRALFQVVVTAQYITRQDTRQRVARFRAYHDVLAAQLIDVRKDEPTFMAEFQRRTLRTLRQLHAARRRAKARFPNFRSGAMGWTGHTLEQVATLVDQKGAYDSLYRIGSQFEHTSFYAIHSYAIGSAMTIESASAPSTRLVNETLATVFIEMLILHETIVRAFKIGLLRELRPLKSLIPSFRAILPPPSKRDVVGAMVQGAVTNFGLAVLCQLR